MADNSYDVATTTSAPLPYTKPEDPSDSALGSLAPFDYSSEPFVELSEDAKGALMQLDIIATKTDVAARRLQVEQALKVPVPSIA